MTTPRFCALIPTSDNPRTVRAVVERVRAHLPEILLVDDGSAAPGREAVRGVERDPDPQERPILGGLAR